MKKLERMGTIFVIVMAVVVSLSCAIGAGETATNTPQPPVATQLPAATLAVPTQPVQTQAIVSPQPVETQNVASPQPATGVTPTAPEINTITGSEANLDSYSMSLAIHQDGTDDKGNPYKQDFTFAEDTIKSQKADHFKISGMGALLGVSSGDLDIYQIDTSLYMYSPAQNDQKASCLAMSSGSSPIVPSTMNPGSMMKDIQTDQLLEKGVTVNGVVADHYSVKSTDMGFGTATSESGEVWLVEDGGYPVKFTGQAQGTFDESSFGSTSGSFTGTTSWDYELTNVNQLKSIDVPPECTQPTTQSDLPIPSNAAGLSQLGGMTVFTSPDKPADVSAYFKKNLPDKGWTVDSVDDSLGSVITIDISKSDQKMQIMITAGSSGSGSSVIITAQ